MNSLLASLFIGGVLPVNALLAIAQHITQGGVGVDQLQELQSLIGMLRSSADAVQRALNSGRGVVGAIDRIGDVILCHAVSGSPADSSGRPALASAEELTLIGLVGNVSILVDDAILEPAVQQFQLMQVVFLLQHVNNLAGFVLDSYANSLQAGAQVVIIVEDTVPGVAGGQVHRIEVCALAFLHLAEDGIQVVHGVDGLHIDVVLLYQLMVEIPELGQRGILVGGHCIDGVIDSNTSPQSFRNGLIQFGSYRLHLIGDVQESLLLYETVVISVAGEHDIKGIAAVDHALEGLLIGIPVVDGPVNRYANLLTGVSVNVFQGCIEVARSNAANAPPTDVGNFTGTAAGIRSAAVARSVAAAGISGGAAAQDARSHGHSHEQCENSLCLHNFCLLKPKNWFL